MRDWWVGTHAYGDRAVRVLPHVCECVLERNPDLPTGTLVLEHGGLAGPEQRVRAVALGIPATIQQPLLHDTAEAEEGLWDPERVARLFPARGWIDVPPSSNSDRPFGCGRLRALTVPGGPAPQGRPRVPHAGSRRVHGGRPC